MGDILYMVIPCYNEEEVLPETAKRLKEKYTRLIATGKISEKSKIAFVDDGSKDRTWALIEELHESDPVFTGVKLSRNRGHQNALLGGLLTVADAADVTISMDADLQDDIEAIDAMIDKYRDGTDIVYGVRNDRKKDSFFKKSTAQGFYKLLRRMGVESVYNHADFRLMSKRAVKGLAEFKEVNLFLRGMVPMVGYSHDFVYYERGERFAGESKYPLKKMLAFAFEGITSLSVKPIRLITSLGFIIFLVSIILAVYFFVRYLLGMTVTGWVTLAMSLWILGGLQLMAIGVVGEYVGKIYLEAKGRPRFIIEKYLK